MCLAGWLQPLQKALIQKLGISWQQPCTEFLDSELWGGGAGHYLWISNWKLAVAPGCCCRCLAAVSQSFLFPSSWSQSSWVLVSWLLRHEYWLRAGAHSWWNLHHSSSVEMGLMSHIVTRVTLLSRVTHSSTLTWRECSSQAEYQHGNKGSPRQAAACSRKSDLDPPLCAGGTILCTGCTILCTICPFVAGGTAHNVLQCHISCTRRPRPPDAHLRDIARCLRSGNTFLPSNIYTRQDTFIFSCSGIWYVHTKHYFLPSYRCHEIWWGGSQAYFLLPLCIHILSM